VYAEAVVERDAFREPAGPSSVRLDRPSAQSMVAQVRSAAAGL